MIIKDQETVEDLKKTFIQSREVFNDAKDISDEVFDIFCQKFNDFNGFYDLDLLLEKYNLSDVQKHFLVSLFFIFSPTRETPEKNEYLQEMVDNVLMKLGYFKARLYDRDFNRKVYTFIMLNEKCI